MPVAEKITTASDLAKHTKRVLDDASKGPVSIPRPNKPSITLVDRDAYYHAIFAEEWLAAYNAIVRYVVDVAGEKENPACPAEFSWLSAFDLEDLRAFLDEVSLNLHLVLHGMKPWETVESTIVEWRRSAAVALDADVQRRFQQTLGDLTIESDRGRT